jgi:hypothetical protein
VPLSCEHSHAVGSVFRASVGRDPPNIITHGPVLVKPAPFPPRAHHHRDRHEGNYAYYANQHDERL